MSSFRLRRPKPRTFLARQFVRLAEKWTSRTMLPVDFLPARLGPRWGHGAPPHQRLLDILAAGEPAYRRNLEAIVGYREALAEIPLGPGDGEEGPVWRNKWLPGLDSAAIYGLIRSRRPSLYLEVGSGMSTLFARRAIEDGGLACRIHSIDPAPRDERADTVSDRIVREPLETLDLTLFQRLEPGDVLFVDGSHRVLTNSDATVFFLDVLPELPEGVLVGIHDVLLPDDYLPEWEAFHWSEQYLMAAYLLGGGGDIELELASRYVTDYSDLSGVVEPLWSTPGLEEVDRRGFALWFTTTGRG